MRPLLALALSLVGGCASSGVDLTLHIEGLAAPADELRVEASGAEISCSSIPVSGVTPPIRLRYRSLLESGSIDFRVTAYAQAGVAIGDTSFSVRLDGGHGGAEVTLAPVASIAPVPPAGCPAVADLGTPDLGESDLAPSDLGGPDLAVLPGGPSLCATAGLDFCDGFEGGISMAWGGQMIIGGSLTPVQSPVFRGQWALSAKLASGSVNSIAMLNYAAPSAVPRYLRAWVYLQSPLNSTALVETLSDPETLSLVLNAGGQLGRYAGSMLVTQAAPALETNRWYCLRWKLADSLGEPGVQAFVGDDPLPALDVNENALMLHQISIGLQTDGTSAPTPIEIILDEIAFDKAPIGCER